MSLKRIVFLILCLIPLTGTLHSIHAQGGCTSPSFSPQVTYGVGTNPYSVATADFDGDGILDLAVANYNSNNVSVLLGEGDGTFGTSAFFSVGNGPVSAIVAGDFNGDSHLDLAVANWYSHNVSILLGNGAGSFGFSANYAVGSYPRAIASADFNEDGHVDLVTPNSNAGSLSVLFGNGIGGFPSSSTVPVGTTPCSVSIADFNEDGHLDIAETNADSRNVGILLGNGSGGFGNLAFTGFSEKPYSVTTGDLNGDGDVDLAVAVWDPGRVYAMLGNGTGSFGTPTGYGAGSGSTLVIAGDFNRDLLVDLAVANSLSDNISVLLGSGTGSFGSAHNFAVGDDPRFVCAGDFNGDDAPDLAVPNHGVSTISVLLNLCANVPPIAMCTSVTVNAGANCAEDAAIDNGSYDPDGDPITLTQTPAGPYPSGTTSVLLTVTDVHGAFSTCTGTVTVLDQTPPVISCPGNISRNSDPNACTAVVTYSVVVSDNCPGVAYACAPPSGSAFPAGVSSVICLAMDAAANSASCSFTVEVVDNVVPAISVTVDPSVLPKASKKMEPIAATVAVTDNCSGASFVLYSITDNQGSDPNDVEDADFGTPDLSFKLRAERKGKTARIYTIVYRALDAWGNVTEASATVTVPAKIPKEAADPDESAVPSVVLLQNHPNPFQTSTVISYRLPDEAPVTLRVFDVYSREVAVLVNDIRSAGTHTVEFDASNLPSGSYFCMLQTTPGTVMKKLVVMK